MDQFSFATCSDDMQQNYFVTVHGVHLSNATLLNVHEAVS